MQGIIIAGGQGTRLQPLTFVRPKPLIPVLNRALLEYQVELLRENGVDRIVFATNYMAEAIEDHFGDGARYGVAMRYAVENEPLGTAGAIRNAANSLWARDETFVVFNGDILCDFHLTDVIQFHLDQEAEATITVKPVPSPSAFGVIHTDTSGRVTQWYEPSEEEKKRIAAMTDWRQTGWDHINAGFYVLEPAFLERVPASRAVSIERETFPQMIAEQARLFACVCEGYWQDVGRPSQLIAVSAAMAGGQTAIPGIPPAARIDESVLVLGHDVVCGSGLECHGVVVVGDNCCIGNNVMLTDTILMARCHVGDGCRLNNTIIDADCTLEDNCVLANTVMATKSHVNKASKIGNLP